MALIGHSRYPEPGLCAQIPRRSPSSRRGDSPTPKNFVINTGDAVLDELGDEAKKLLALLEEPEPGCVTWHDFLRTRMQKINELTSRMLGK